MIRLASRPPKTQAAIDATPFHRFELPDGTVWTEFYRVGSEYLLRFPGLADFEVSADGTRVSVCATRTTDNVTVEHLYVNQVVPLALSRQGRPAFHASVVTVAGGAVAFLGRAGMGKSTLAASFALEDSEFLTDDSLIVVADGDGYLALPSHPSLRLWNDSVEALVDDQTRHGATVSYSTKARLLAGDALSHREEPQRLLAAYLLERENAVDVAVRKLSGGARHMAWVNNSFLLDIEDRELLERHFDWTHRVTEAVPTFALDYPREYGMLPKVRDFVRRQVASL